MLRLINSQPPYTVKEIAVTVRATKEFAGGNWRTIELSARADVSPYANVEFAHNDLYESLRQRIALFFNGR